VQVFFYVCIFILEVDEMAVTEQTIDRSLVTGIEEARATLARHGKSFNWASALFSRKVADRAAELYAFCRYADDLADDLAADLAIPRLKVIAADLKQGRSPEPVVQNLIRMLEPGWIGMQAARTLVKTLLADTGRVRIQSWDDLIRYAHGVAGTVGIMMCDVMGVDDRRALPFAVDLGIGMQLTNIARDVVEDARRDRIYLPAELFDEPITPVQIINADSSFRKRLFECIRSVLQKADLYYRSADGGLRYLPRRCRLVILTAARIYEAIGPNIIRDRKEYWQNRIYVGFFGKMFHTLRAISDLTVNPKLWHLGRLPVHNGELHTALRGLPGANSEAG
jgi:phytoene synthase